MVLVWAVFLSDQILGLLNIQIRLFALAVGLLGNALSGHYVWRISVGSDGAGSAADLVAPVRIGDCA
jgi:hypothetical protein